MNIRFGLIKFLLMQSSLLMAAGELTTTGARSAAMGNASIVLYDAWSGSNNQAGLAWSKRFSAGVYYENRFLIKELSMKAIAAVLPVKKGAFGLSFSHFGFNLYNEIKAGIAFGMRFGNAFSTGIQIDYLRFHAGNDYGTTNLFTFEIGVQYRIRQKIFFGAHLYNPVPFRLTDDPPDLLPTVFRLGIGWNISDNFLTVAEIEKDMLNTPNLKAGMEYHLMKPLFIRLGYMTAPSQFTFGFGLEIGRLSLDIASSYHMILGFSPQCSVIYFFK